MLVTHERVTDPGAPEPAARGPLARRYAIGWGLVALGLVTIVAMAAHGAAWSDDRGGEVRSLPHAVTFAGAVVAFCLAVVLILLVLARAGVPETAEQRRRRWMIAIALLLVLAAISMLRGFVHPADRADRDPATAAPVNGRDTGSGSHRDGSPSTTWWPLVIVSIGTAGALFVATARRTRKTEPDASAGAATIALLDASLDDLRREPDARRAVVAAYARMEGGLAARGFPRHAAETPTEYLRRAKDAGAGAGAGTGGSPTLPAGALQPVAVRALGELTALAERARFSALAIDETMRARAIDALEQLRDELRVTDEAEPEAGFDRVG